jgi:hypothetical protein
VKLTADDLQRLHTKQVANIIRKLGEGKTITSREQKILDEEQTRGESTAAGTAATTAFVQNWDELADAIPIDRRTLQNFRDHEAALIEANKKDLIRSDGRKCVVAWRALLNECGVKGRGANNTDPHMPDVRDMQLREWKFKLDKSEFALQKEKDLVLPRTEFEAALSVTLSKFVAALNALPGRGAGKLLPRARAALVAALKKALPPKTFERVDAALSKDFAIDFAEIEETLQNEVELVKRTLETCDYLKPAENLE